jgi:hypothetical protein
MRSLPLEVSLLARRQLGIKAFRRDLEKTLMSLMQRGDWFGAMLDLAV